jgi:Tfp pilus assembly protein PilN
VRNRPGAGTEEGILAIREINLIPSDIAVKSLIMRHLIVWSGCFALSVGIVLAAGSVQKHMASAKQQTLSSMKAVPVQLASRIEVLKNLQRDQERLGQLRSALTALHSKSPPPSPVLSKLSEIMNDETWLVQLSIDTDEGQEKGQEKGQMRETSLKLIGFSTSNEHLGDFLNRLSAERLFKSVVLKFASESEKEPGSKDSISASRIRFEIACQLTGNK